MNGLHFRDQARRCLRKFVELFRSRREWCLILGMAVAMQYVEHLGVFANLQGWVSNVYQRGSWSKSRQANIITIGIDRTESENYFGGTSPLDPGAVRSLVAAIQAAHPAVVGVDLITDDAGYSNADPQRPWPTESGEAPIVWAAGTLNGRLERAAFVPRFINLRRDRMVATPRHVLGRDPARLGFDWGLAIYPYDEDGVTRRLPRQWYVDDGDPFENTFARQVARAYCRARNDAACDRRADADEVLLPFDGKRLRADHYSVTPLVRCRRVESNVCNSWEFRGAMARTQDWRKTIVILGGDSPDLKDVHRTPIGEQTPGLWINASAVRAELYGPRLEGLSHLAGLALDIALGFFTAAVFGGISAALGIRVFWRFVLGMAVAVSVSFLVFWKLEIVWVSWIGMLSSGMAWDIIVDLIREDRLHRGGPSATPAPDGGTPVQPA